MIVKKIIKYDFVWNLVKTSQFGQLVCFKKYEKCLKEKLFKKIWFKKRKSILINLHWTFKFIWRTDGQISKNKKVSRASITFHYQYKLIFDTAEFTINKLLGWNCNWTIYKRFPTSNARVYDRFLNDLVYESNLVPKKHLKLIGFV